MNRYKIKGQPQPTPKAPRPHEIDAVAQKLAEFIQKDPKKAAKIFESWLDAKGNDQKRVHKKPAA